MALRCGRINYTNDLPIYTAFDVDAIGYPGSLHADVPAKLNAMLVSGELDLSPISAFAWARACRRAGTAAGSVYRGARRGRLGRACLADTAALLDGVTIALTSESASGRNLLRVVLERRYGVQPRYLELGSSARGRGAGQTRAFDRRLGDRCHRTLSGATRSTISGSFGTSGRGQQTVFAVWAARRDAYERNPEAIRECMHALTDSYTWSRSHMDVVVAAAQRVKPRAPGFYESYYGKLNFTFHSAAQSGLGAFCRELHAIGAITAVPHSLPEAIGVVSR